MANDVRLDQVAKPVFGITPRRYRQMASEDIVPAPTKGKIDFVKAARALIEYYRNLAAAQGSLSLTDVRIRKEAARAEREELIVKKLKGELVARDQAMEWLSLLVGSAKAHLWGLPKRLAGPMSICTDAKETEQLMRVEIRRILEDMGRPLKKMQPVGKKI